MSERLPTKNPWYVPALFVVALVLLSPILLPIALILLTPWLKVRFIQRPGLLRRVKREWLPRKKFILFVYSDNGLWKEYAEDKIIPKIEPAAVILNWSRHKDWIGSDSLETLLFRNFMWGDKWKWQKNARMGGQDYNHLAIVLKPWRKPKVIKFWKAFKDHEFGKEDKLRAVENELFSHLRVDSSSEHDVNVL